MMIPKPSPKVVLVVHDFCRTWPDAVLEAYTGDTLTWVGEEDGCTWALKPEKHAGWEFTQAKACHSTVTGLT